MTENPDGEGMILNSVRDGSPGDEAGLRFNDVVLSIGDLTVNDHEVRFHFSLLLL